MSPHPLPSPHPSLLLSILVGLDLNVRRVVRTRLPDLDLDMVVLLLLRKTKPDAPRPYKVSLIMPIVTLIVGSCLVILPIVTTPTMGYLLVVLSLMAGILVYIPFVYYKNSLSCMGWVTRTTQLILNVGPTKSSID